MWFEDWVSLMHVSTAQGGRSWLPVECSNIIEHFMNAGEVRTADEEREWLVQNQLYQMNLNNE